MYKVCKQLNFSYAHRLLYYPGKCAHLHGHNALVEIELKAEQLDTRGLLIDFNDIKDIANCWIDQTLDHKTILCKQDPLAKLLADFGEPLFLMDENPTAEALAKLMLEALREKGLAVSQVRIWETPSSCAVYEES
ncbi:MAG: 6-carboxytetrahydropterin synthase [Deltaproteobacteria bacterium]|nr:6-carboxytetrahydropterin synthase [Deltaproteobacteria bacterium]